jgi:hypothetical protein
MTDDGGKPQPESCQTCRFWKAQEDEPPSPEGRCRRSAPVPMFVPELTVAGVASHPVVWPTVGRGDWCGEWRAKEGGVVPTDPVGLLAGLDGDAILERLKAMERERLALLVLRRAAMRKKKDEY